MKHDHPPHWKNLHPSRYNCAKFGLTPHSIHKDMSNYAHIILKKSSNQIHSPQLQTQRQYAKFEVDPPRYRVHKVNNAAAASLTYLELNGYEPSLYVGANELLLYL
jgi:hypothetical protein